MSKLEQLINELCPNGVEYRKIGEICEKITDYTAAGSFAEIAKNVKYINDYEGFAQLIRTTDLKSSFANNNKFVYVDEHAFNYLWRVNLDSEALILPNVGNCGEVYYITPNIFPKKNNVLGPNAILMQSKIANIRFLYHLFTNNNFQSALKKITSSTGQRKFNKTNLKEIVIPLPPLPVQEEIVRILDSFTELTTELTTRKQQYEYYRDRLLTFGEEVEWKILGEKSISNVIDSLHKTPSYTDKSNFSMIRVTDIKEKYVDTNNALKVTEDIFNEFTKKYKPKANDLVMSRVGSYGNVSIIPAAVNVCMGQNTVVIIPNINYNFLYHYLNSRSIKSYVEKNVSGGSQKTLSLQAIKSIPIPNISTELINKIVAILDKFDILANDIKEGLPCEIELRQKQYEYYRDKLLTFKKLEAVE